MASCCDDSDEPRVDYNTEVLEQLSNPVTLTTRTDDNERKPGVLGKTTSVTHRYNTVERRSYEAAVFSMRFAISLELLGKFGRQCLQRSHCRYCDNEVRLYQV
jgi:hypothetical protein